MKIERKEHKRLNAHEVIWLNIPLGKYELWLDGEYFCTLTQEEYYEAIDNNGWAYGK